MSANVNNLEVVHHAFNTLLTSLTPAQMSDFTAQLRAAPLPTGRITTPTSTPQMNQYGLMTPPSGSPARRDKSAARARIKEARMERGKLRPLNAFMAFRSYYSSQLPGLTQKTKSGLIRTLWEQDQWKHFWAIAAKAYSELRDKHIGQTSLEVFLKNVTGLLGVIPADEYLTTMGWALVTDTERQAHLVNSKMALSKHKAPLTSNLSVRDIVEHCYSIGLVPRPARSARSSTGGNVATMSFAAAPNGTMGPGKTTPAQNADNRVFDDLSQAEFDESVHANVSTGSPVGELRTDYNPSIGAVIADQQGALEAYPSQYPYTLHFHPDVQPALAFNPAMVQDDFDPFDISDYVNFDI